LVDSGDVESRIASVEGDLVVSAPEDSQAGVGLENSET
jgi:hypothetical protein